ncbi:unnamed protein product [Medioppia subpectinata]|uniref:Flavin-containing monooxygenase n=1 Tax=Medioppia subpectinata TaxID=1979941 RepID=A0A7R9KU82_9ACAR|nr:unnamed protein product [Medioppia subpectinata]CAG2108807.1 unnamed protein product [Medioppia subpectinata]
MSGKRIAIIGAGQSGLGAFNACREQDFDEVVVYERDDCLCGLWANRDNTWMNTSEEGEGCSRLMTTTTLNSSKEMTAYSDFPPPEHYPNYMHHSLMREYLLLYAERIGIKDHVKLRHELIGCQQNADYDRTGRWRLTVRDIDNDRLFDEVFDGVIVCTGRYHRPVIPDIKDRHLFKGCVVHTNALSDATGFKGQRVVVVGVGNSGIDMAVELSNVCEKVYLSSRTGCWVLSRALRSGLPTDTLVLRRNWRWLYDGWTYPLGSLVATSWINVTRFDHKLYGLKPGHRAFSQGVVFSDDLPIKIIRGLITMKANIEQFTETGVIFAGDTVETLCDAVIYGTGYQLSYPFLPDELRPELNPDLRLYKHIFFPHLKHPQTLAITSNITPTGAGNPMMELQGRYFALLMADRCRLPSEKRMFRDIRRQKAWAIRQYPSYDKYATHVQYLKYMDELAVQMGVKPRLWKYLFTDPILWWHLYFEACVPYQYRLNGKIFALLGPNGAGKTTLMRAILGQLKLKSGTISVFGKKLGSVGSGIPGPGVGYMPQDVRNLRDLLHLPESSRIISELSGGERRRVSIAITMIHKPRLVILDEPTVGVDSLLRHRIWQYLDNMCDKYGQTVIITTHYIEEARSAHNVAFMRCGAVLRQSNPQQLMAEYQCPTLEDVFLQLCHLSESGVTLDQDLRYKDNTDIDLNSINTLTTIEANIDYKNNEFIDWQRMKALLIKQWIIIKRRPILIAIYYGIIISTLVSLNMVISQNINNIAVGISNNDITLGDNQTSLAHLFVDSIDPKSLSLSQYESIDSAVQSVRNGDNYLTLEFRDNFTDCFESRVIDTFDATDECVEQNKLGQMLDKTNIYDQMSIMRVTEVLNGDLNNVLATFTIFGPQMLVMMQFCYAMLLSSGLMINDVSSPIMSRVLAAGVTEYEYCGAHTLINAIAGLVHVSVAMIVVFAVFGVQTVGSYCEIFLFLFLQNLVGILTGFLVAVILADAASLMVAIWYILNHMVYTSGLVWPIEAIPQTYRFIAYTSPVTLPVQSMINIMLRGWSYTQPNH